MLSKLISRVKTEKQQNTQDIRGKQPDSTSYQELEKTYLTSRSINFDDLSKYRVSSVDAVYYIPNYITEDDEKYLLGCIDSQPSERWSILQHANRRLQRWGGEVTPKGLENIEALPPWLEKISETLSSEKITEKKTNHVLLNEYPPGIGIMPHTDGPLYHPYVVILSLGSHACFEFFKDYANYKAEQNVAKLLVEPRSLLIFEKEAYTKFLHSIHDSVLDSIEVTYTIDKSNNSVKITSSNIDNIHLTKIYGEIQKELESGSNNSQDEKEFTKTWQLKRTKRISLTIRYVIPSNAPKDES